MRVYPGKADLYGLFEPIVSTPESGTALLLPTAGVLLFFVTSDAQENNKRVKTTGEIILYIGTSLQKGRSNETA